MCVCEYVLLKNTEWRLSASYFLSVSDVKPLLRWIGEVSAANRYSRWIDGILTPSSKYAPSTLNWDYVSASKPHMRYWFASHVVWRGWVRYFITCLFVRRMLTWPVMEPLLEVFFSASCCTYSVGFKSCKHSNVIEWRCPTTLVSFLNLCTCKPYFTYNVIVASCLPTCQLT